MKTIRLGTFETNSSSAHALIYEPKKNFENFKNGEMVLQLGGFGVPDSYLSGRGWDTTGGKDGKLLSWTEARNLYVEYLKTETRHRRQNYINLLNWNVRKGIRKPDDITVKDFIKAVAYGETDRQGYSSLVFGMWLNYNEWKISRCDEYGNHEESKAVDKDEKTTCLDFWWFAG